MPNRIIRGALLDSDRYWSLSSDTLRLVFVHFLIAADDLGNSEASGPYVRRRILGGRGESDEAIAKILSELADADLLRVYMVGAKRYIHIPRFRQRLRFFKRVNPRPPDNIECKEIKELLSKQSDYSQSMYGLQTAEVKRSEVKRSEAVQDQDQSQDQKPTPRTRPDRGTRLPQPWQPDDEWLDWAVGSLNLKRDDVMREALVFRDFWYAKAGANGRKVDWLATWRNWMRRYATDRRPA